MPTLKKYWPLIFPLGLVVIFLVGQIYEQIVFVQSLDQYDKRVKKCVTTECIIKTIQEVYKENPERGLDLCVEYELTKNISMSKGSQRGMCELMFSVDK